MLTNINKYLLTVLRAVSEWLRAARAARAKSDFPDGHHGLLSLCSHTGASVVEPLSA